MSTPGHLADIEQTREALREQARVKLGVVGDENTRACAGSYDSTGSATTVNALGALFVATGFQTYAFTVLTPEISRSLGIPVGLIDAARGLQLLARSPALRFPWRY